MSAVLVELPVKTVTESNSGGHWRAKAKRAKEQRHIAWMSLAARGGQYRWASAPPCVVTLTRIAPRPQRVP